jgi:hypothetical protein
MRFYDLLNFQHIMLYAFPTLVFIVIFGLFLAYSHLGTVIWVFLYILVTGLLEVKI